MKKNILTVLVLLLSLFLVSCNLGKEEKRTGEQVEITQTVTKVLQRDDKGVVSKSEKQTIKEKVFINPKRVVTFNYGIADAFLYVGLDKLGITKFGLSKGTGLPVTLKAFNNDRTYPNIGTLHAPNFDTLDLFNPELIILDGRTTSYYEEMKEKYPNSDVIDLSLTTYEFDKHKENFLILEKIFTKAGTQFTDLIDGFEESFLEIQEVTKNYGVLFVQLNGKDISVATGPNGRFGLIYKEFGFTVPENFTFDPSLENNHGTVLFDGPENILEINPDVIVIMDRNIIAVGEPSEDFTKDPSVAEVNAIKNGHVYQLDPTSWYTVSGGITATEQMIADIMVFINKVKEA